MTSDKLSRSETQRDASSAPLATGGKVADVDLEAFDWPQSLRGINDLAPDLKRALYLSLIPASVLERFGADPEDADRLRIHGPAHTRAVEIILMPPEGAPPPHDPVFYLHMADTFNNQIAILLVIVNDPYSERFRVDVSEEGLPTRFGTLRRNIPEEVRAMEAGLAPGQIRKGLRISREAIPTFERFIRRTGNDMVIIEPLTYNNAIVYESYGFDYFHGHDRMVWIDKAVRPGGALHPRFDGSTPFRPKEGWKSVLGRSWAIYDGILGEPLGDIRMYKRLGHKANVNTFSDGVWAIR